MSKVITDPPIISSPIVEGDGGVLLAPPVTYTYTRKSLVIVNTSESGSSSGSNSAISLREEAKDADAKVDVVETHTAEQKTSESPESMGTVVICTSCYNSSPTEEAVVAPCTHAYCHPCVLRQISSALTAPHRLPSCCAAKIPLELITHLIDRELVPRLTELYEEIATPGRRRTYCAIKTCSRFIPRERNGICPDEKCGRKTCVRCKSLVSTKAPYCQCRSSPPVRFSRSSIPLFTKRKPPSPSDFPYAMAVQERPLLRLARRRNWQTCPHCANLVERTEGCNSMECVCGTGFCYCCGKEWCKRRWRGARRWWLLWIA